MKILTCMIRSVFLTAMTIAMVACGGGGGGSGSIASAAAPVLSNLVLSPSAAYTSTTPLTFSGSFDFTDSDGNLESISLKITNGAGATVSDEIMPVQDGSGLKSGTLLGSLVAVAVDPDTYTFAIFAIDATGLKSNTLRGTVRIAAFPWVAKLADPLPREYAAAVSLNGLVYVIGGQRTDSGITPGPATAAMEIYDPATDTWRAAASMPTARMGLVAATVNGKVYAIGGRTDGYSISAVGSVEEYDPVSNLWRSLNPMPTPRYFAAGAVLEGQIFVIGGESELMTLGVVQAYNPVADSWRSRTSMTMPRGQLAAGVANGRLYAVGGYAGVQFQWVGSVEAYDPVTDTWGSKAAMPTPRAQLALTQTNGQLLAAGGENVNRALDTLESYDPLTDAWRAKTPSAIPFTRDAAAVVNGKTYLFGNGHTLVYDPANEIR